LAPTEISVSPKKLQPGTAQRSMLELDFLTQLSSWQLLGSTTLASSVLRGRAACAWPKAPAKEMNKPEKIKDQKLSIVYFLSPSAMCHALAFVQSIIFDIEQTQGVVFDHVGANESVYIIEFHEAKPSVNLS
jgi:hypothetical protein